MENVMENTAEFKLTSAAVHKILVLAREFYERPENRELYNELLEIDRQKQMSEEATYEKI